MSEAYLILGVTLVLGLISQNSLIASAALLLILLKLADWQGSFTWLLHYGIQLGLFFLILTILVPVAADRLSLGRFASELFSLSGLVAVAVSAFSAYLARFGVDLLESHPQVLVGLIVGSVVGVLLFRGVPTGPLIAAGVTALLARWLHAP